MAIRREDQNRRLVEYIKQNLKEGKPFDFADPVWWEGDGPTVAEVFGPERAKEWAETVKAFATSEQALKDLAALLPGYDPQFSWSENVMVAFAREYHFTREDFLNMS